MTLLRVSPEAEAAVCDQARQSGLGLELVAVVEAAFDAIAAGPESFPLWRPDREYRRMVVTRFPYVVFFRHDAADDEVLVVAIAHARRRPGYWVGRRR